MITKEQFVNGLLKYADNEVMPALSTAGKWGVGTMLTLASGNANNVLNELITNPLVKSLGIVSDEGLIDCGKLIDALKQTADKYGNLQIALPIIGTLTFNSADVEKLRQYMGS